MSRMIGKFVLPVLAVAVGIVLASMGADAADRADIDTSSVPYDTVSLAPRDVINSVQFPKVLSDADAELYRQIFRIQEAGEWKQADRLIKKLEDKILLGQVLAQRYLHPTKYRSRYKELKAWMDEYNDHPDAPRLYKLALRRKPNNWRSPKSPATIRNAPLAGRSEAAPGVPSKRLSTNNRSKVRDAKRQIRRALRRGHTLAAKRILLAPQTKKLFSNAEYDEYSAKLGQAYFSAGRDEWALKWVGAAAARSGKYIPQAHWTAGLASWRLGEKKIAADHFAKAAQLSRDDDWFHAAAAFWAGRAYLVTQQPEKVNGFLREAAKNGRTFYGLLSRRVLGEDLGLSWRLPVLDQSLVEQLMDRPRGYRAMALLQVGEERRAERELRNLALGATQEIARGVLGLAARGNMASLAVRLDAKLFPNGGGFDGAAYPIPVWTPGEGFRVDRALIYALIRQESKFNPKAKSWAGARGLMQLMPRTASFVAQDRRLHRGQKTKLYQPEVNLNLGQKYIEMLLEDKKIAGDLFLLAAAWNGGPGNLNKWRKSTNYMNDPLFFIESIPSRETRVFIERVLSNLWIYRDRLGQEKPSLDAIATGKWPLYTPLGQASQEVAENYVTRNSN